MVVTISMLLSQLLLVVPAIIVGITTITGAINGAFNIQNGKVKHIISWAVALVCGLLMVLTGGVTFGLGWVDYVIGAVYGLIAGGAANGLYDWEVVKNIIDKFYNLFGHGEKKVKD